MSQEYVFADLPVVTVPAPAIHADLLWEEDPDGFETIDAGPEVVQKSELIGFPFLIGEVIFREGKFGSYATVRCVNKDNAEFVFNDGSTGVCQQLIHHFQKRDMISTDKPSGAYQTKIMCKKGLRVSNYERENGQPASTYYIA